LDGSNRIYESSHYDNLVKVIKSTNAIAYIGSGLSQMGKTYMSWPNLVKKLCDVCNVDYPDDDNLDEKELIMLSEEAKKRDYSSYCDTLKQEFATRPGSMPRIYTLLFQLPFQSYLTTNFDPTLHLASIDYNNVKDDASVSTFGTQMCDATRLENKNVFYLHGLANLHSEFECEKLILSKSDFEEAYEEDHTLKSFLFTVFKYKPVVFFGCKLKEEPIKRIFDACKESQLKMSDRKKDFPPKYILLPSFIEKVNESELEKEEIREREENNYYEELGINVVRYDPIPDFTKLEEIVEDWAEQSSNYVASFSDQSPLGR